MKLSRKEREVLDALLTARPSVVAIHNHVSEGRIANIKTRVRRKEARARKFLRELKKYKRVLHTERRYKGI